MSMALSAVQAQASIAVRISKMRIGACVKLNAFLESSLARDKRLTRTERVDATESSSAGLMA